ncbi:MAG: hypothetical protein D6681_01425 [Calditrichaeota bacterium]|nr:MAG: hypothetical protein D6681_01425 [Calditrichota bacterium]
MPLNTGKYSPTLSGNFRFYPKTGAPFWFPHPECKKTIYIKGKKETNRKFGNQEMKSTFSDGFYRGIKGR